MNQSSLTEETPAAPGWVDRRVREIFEPLGEAGRAAGDSYADCIAGVRGAVDVDAGHDGCRRAALGALKGGTTGPGEVDLGEIDRQLQALEAEISAAT